MTPFYLNPNLQGTTSKFLGCWGSGLQTVTFGDTSQSVVGSVLPPAPCVLIRSTPLFQ